MGWYYSHRDRGMTDREYFTREFDHIDIIECATVKNVFYAAARHKQRPEEVFALATLIHRVPRDYHNFGYKPMDETVGPCAYNAPAKVLDLLTPTTSEWALEWRAKCREVLAAKATRPKVKAGQTVTFAQPITFRSGRTLSEFTFEGRSIFRAGLSRYQITNWREREYSIA